jgi:hypothetical protein
MAEMIGGVYGIPVDELKKAGFSDKDIEYIRELALLYKSKISGPGIVSAVHEAASVIAIAHGAFEAGIACGVARGKKLKGVAKKFGFVQ